MLLVNTRVPLFNPRSPQDWGDWFVGPPLRIALVVFLGWVTLMLVKRMIRSVAEHLATGRYLWTKTAAEPEPGGAAPAGSPSRRRKLKAIADNASMADTLAQVNPLASARRAQRARTVGAVLSSLANIVIGLTVVLLVLSELRVSIAPFLASAGIAGIALGFGAQSLVKDFLSGMFMLLEDQYGVGDTVDFGAVTGVVEDVQLRVTKVRDANGTLWFIRNGEILRTGNKTQEWGRAVVEVRLAYDTDVTVARATLLAAAHAVTADPQLGAGCLEAPEVLGIESLTAEALALKVQIKTAAQHQWDVARALREQLRQGLNAAGLHLAGAQQVVVISDPPRGRR